MSNTLDARYPIGKYIPEPYSETVKLQWINAIKHMPQDLELAIQQLDEHQLDTPYREGGWIIKQLVHHLADSHLNAYTRFKCGITEDLPTIKLYDEKEWANLSDVHSVPVNVSVTLLFALHKRWVAFLEPLTEEQWQRPIFHPGFQKELTLWFMLGLYAWHSKHHVAHITAAKTHYGW